MTSETNQSDVLPPRKSSIAEVIHDLQDSSAQDRTPTSAYYGLSDLSESDLRTFESSWNSLQPEVKRRLLSDLADASEANFEFDYQAIGMLSLDDADSGVRVNGIQLLWSDESPTLLNKLIDLIETDDNVEVRAAALSDLGRFILLGEYEDIPQSDATRAQEVAIVTLEDLGEDIEVRRRALEAISNSSLEYVAEAIADAYENGERPLRVSALFAMGRSYDTQWNDIVLREMRSDDPEMRYEAARAAGELEIQEAVSLLGQLAVVDEAEIKEVAIWSLGEIGGNQALRLLTALAEDAEEAEDENLLEAVEDAIGYASMSGNSLKFDTDS